MPGLGVLARYPTMPHLGYWWASRVTTTKDDGTFELPDVPVGEVELDVDEQPFDGGCVVYDTLVEIPKVPVRAGETTALGIIELGVAGR